MSVNGDLLADIATALVQSNEGQKLEPSLFDHKGKRVLLVQGPNEIYEVAVQPWKAQQ